MAEKKLFRVTLSTDIVVYAEDEVTAADIARGHSTYDLGGTYDDLEPEVWSEFSLPEGWDENCIPFGADEDMTVAELLAMREKSGGE